MGCAIPRQNTPRVACRPRGACGTLAGGLIDARPRGPRRSSGSSVLARALTAARRRSATPVPTHGFLCGSRLSGPPRRRHPGVLVALEVNEVEAADRAAVAAGLSPARPVDQGFAAAPRSATLEVPPLRVCDGPHYFLPRASPRLGGSRPARCPAWILSLLMPLVSWPSSLGTR